MSTIKCTLDNLAKTLEKEVQKEVKQAKFAAMKALNNVAFKARDNLIKNYNASFKVRNKSLPKAVTVIKATKENLQAEVEFPKDWMEINVKGGTKQADSGKNLAFPSDKLEGESRLQSGKIKKTKRPASLLDYADKHKKRGKNKKGTSKPHAFKTKGKHGYEVIGIRDGKETKWPYSIQKTAKVPKRWDFYGIVKKTAERNLPKEFEKEFKKAMETAK